MWAGTRPASWVLNTDFRVSLIFFKLIYFNWRLITLRYYSGFCHTLTWISHGCICVPYLESPSHLSPQPIPQGCPSALALSALFHALNLAWWPISHMVIYIFQCYFSNHPTLTFSHRVQKSILYICVSFAILHIGSSLTTFLNRVSWLWPSPGASADIWAQITLHGMGRIALCITGCLEASLVSTH